MNYCNWICSLLILINFNSFGSNDTIAKKKIRINLGLNIGLPLSNTLKFNSAPYSENTSNQKSTTFKPIFLLNMNIYYKYAFLELLYGNNKFDLTGPSYYTAAGYTYFVGPTQHYAVQYDLYTYQKIKYTLNYAGLGIGTCIKLSNKFDFEFSLRWLVGLRQTFIVSNYVDESKPYYISTGYNLTTHERIINNFQENAITTQNIGGKLSLDYRMKKYFTFSAGLSASRYLFNNFNSTNGIFDGYAQGVVYQFKEMKTILLNFTIKCALR